MSSKHAILFMLLLCLISHQTTTAEGFIDIVSIVKATFGATYGLRHLSIQSKLVDHFFNGLDEVKQCIDPWSNAVRTSAPPPSASWLSLLKARVFPWYADVLHSHWFETSLHDDHQKRQRQRRRRWAGCVVGPLRSAAAAYLVVTESFLPMIPNVAVPRNLRSLPKKARKILGPIRKRLASSKSNLMKLKWYWLTCVFVLILLFFLYLHVYIQPLGSTLLCWRLLKNGAMYFSNWASSKQLHSWTIAQPSAWFSCTRFLHKMTVHPWECHATLLICWEYVTSSRHNEDKYAQ